MNTVFVTGPKGTLEIFHDGNHLRFKLQAPDGRLFSDLEGIIHDALPPLETLCLGDGNVFQFSKILPPPLELAVREFFESHGHSQAWPENLPQIIHLWDVRAVLEWAESKKSHSTAEIP